MSKAKKSEKVAPALSAALAEKPATAAQPVKQNAAQKIEALENMVMAQNQNIDMLADEIDRLRQLITGLNKRVNASIQAAEQGEVTGESVNKIIMNENMKELEAKISFLVDQGVLERNDELEISEQTFVVGREIDAEGNVVNPRVQFAVNSIDKDVRNRLMTKKAGDVIGYSETEPSLEITEVYQIIDPKIKKNFEGQPAAQ